MAVLMDFAIFPTDKGAHVSPQVSRVVQLIKWQNPPYQLTAMGTLVETPTVGEALLLVEQAAALLETDSTRIYATIKLDIKSGASNMLEEKVRSVENKL